MRFRRRAKLFPGVYINFSKSGISTTIGVPGLSVNLGSKGAFLNTGIPGTGLYDRQRIGGKQKKYQYLPSAPETLPSRPIVEEEIGAIKTEHAEAVTTEGLQELKKTLLECYQEREDLKKEIPKAEKDLRRAKLLMVFSYVFILGIFIKWFRQNKNNKYNYLEDLKEQLNNCFVNIDIDIDPQIGTKYIALIENYNSLLTCSQIWDITSSRSNDQRVTRSAASESVRRRPVKFGFGNIDIIKSKYDSLHFENANGGDLYLYPAFIAIVDEFKKFGLIDIRELDFEFNMVRFIEEEKVPADAKVIGSVWAKTNKDGSPDRRFKDNYTIPVCLYGDLKLSSKTGLNEVYCLSSFDKAKTFADALMEYRNVIKYHSRYNK